MSAHHYCREVCPPPPLCPPIPPPKWSLAFSFLRCVWRPPLTLSQLKPVAEYALPSLFDKLRNYSSVQWIHRYHFELSQEALRSSYLIPHWFFLNFFQQFSHHSHLLWFNPFFSDGKFRVPGQTKNSLTQVKTTRAAGWLMRQLQLAARVELVD